MLGLVPVPHRSLGNLAKKYGPLMQLQLGEVPILIMKNHDLIVADRPEIYAGNVMFYNSTSVVFSRYGDYWRDMRRNFVMHLLSAKYMQLFRPLREEEISNTIKGISSQAGVPVNLNKRITSMLSTVTSRAAFGDNCKVSEEVILMIRESLTLVGISMKDLFPSLKLIHRLGGMTSKLLGLHQEVDKFLERVIQEHINNNDANLKEDLVD
ncbi:hypothetical protein MKW94_019423, partial [Papaver nudicaule]|nr:hypothetical protein [Papaver nudicaule]